MRWNKNASGRRHVQGDGRTQEKKEGDKLEHHALHILSER